MSASRPKLAKPKPKPRPFTVEKAEIATASGSRTSSPAPKALKAARPAVSGANGKKAAVVASRAVQATAAPKRATAIATSKDKGKGRAIPGPSRPLGTASEPEVLSSDDESEDDFEEVPIPTTPGVRSINASAGPSSPYPYSQAGTPNTPGTNFTARTTPAPTTAGETDEDPYADDDDSGEEGKGDDVIRLEIGGETAEEKAKRIALALRKKPMSSKDRILRIEIHKLHVLTLLASVRIRNRWANDMLLKARLLSLLPHPLVTAFSIPPSRFPDRAQRARLFVDALQSLVLWWTQTFFDIPDHTIGHRTRPWDEVQEVVDKLPRLTRQDFLPGGPLLQGEVKSDKEKEKEVQERLDRYADGAGGDRLRTVNSLMKKALQQEGSRDVSAVLFVALCRACGLGTRLVVSLQAVPWRAEKVVQKKPSGAGKGGRSVASRQGQGTGDEDDDGDESMEEVPIPGEDDEEGEGGPGEIMEKIKNKKIRGAGRRRQQDPAEVYRLRKPKPAPQTTGAKPKVKTKQDLANQPPVFWAEVFSRPDQKWFPVDVTRGTVRKKGHFEPSSDNGPVRMTYVLAFEEDGYARDVTLRYTKSFGAKTAKLRAPQRKDEPDWWEGVLGFLARPYRLNRDDLEDAELENSQISEAMPVHMSGFKDHPLFVLERHLKREEVIQPRREVGKFRGEPVYRRANVLSCKTAENWMRIGRKVKERQEPLKWVKQRAMTINKRREVELAKQAGEEVVQGLYSEAQTAIYTPPPIKDGKIPQNAFGNIDLYAPTMLPPGAAHLPYKGIAKVAKQLGVSYAEACTGFEFKKQRAIPVITGIVVAEEQSTTVMDAYWASTAAAEERENQKKTDKALKRWAKLINALRVRQRLRATYGDKEGLHDQSHNPLAEGEEGKDKPQAKGKKSAATVLAHANQEASTAWVEQMREGSESPPPSKLPEVTAQDFAAPEGEMARVKIEEEEDDDDMEEVDVVGLPSDNGGNTTASDFDTDIDQRQSIRVPAARSRTITPLPTESSTRRSGRERKTRIAVDNPYEESDEDDEKGLVSDEEGGGSHMGAAMGGEDSEDSMDEVDFTAKEPTPPPAPAPTTRSGRTIKLRVGPVKEAEEVPEEKRATRSSKRKR